MLNEVKHLVIWKVGDKVEILRSLRSLRMTRIPTLCFFTVLAYNL